MNDALSTHNTLRRLISQTHERERERGRERDSQTDRETDRETERQREGEGRRGLE